jgi:hypothetical protein
MPNPADILSRLLPTGEHPSLAFSAFLVFHILAGLTCVVTGAGAAASRKGPRRHPRLGTVYYWALAVVFVRSRCPRSAGRKTPTSSHWGRRPSASRH